MRRAIIQRNRFAVAVMTIAVAHSDGTLSTVRLYLLQATMKQTDIPNVTSFTRVRIRARILMMTDAELVHHFGRLSRVVFSPPPTRAIKSYPSIPAPVARLAEHSDEVSTLV
jgi:hypothetical protein